MIENKVYKSRVDTWLVILFMCVIGFLIWQVIVTNYEWISIVVTVLMTWLLVDLLLHTDYTIGEGVLKVRCGMFIGWDIPIDKILKITPCRTMLSSPALSLQRICIFYNRFDDIIISPKNSQEFVHELLRQNPNIEVKI